MHASDPLKQSAPSAGPRTGPPRTGPPPVADLSVPEPEARVVEAEKFAPVTDLAELLRGMIDAGASDLHITAGVPPKIRVDGSLTAMEYAPLDQRAAQALLYSIMTEDQRAGLEENLEVDFSFGLKDLARFRANVFMQRGSVAGALRVIPWRIPSFEELGLPDVIRDICQQPRGLVLVTGPTGSGKSTTLAAMIDLINSSEPHHIITIEDPIEYLHKHKTSVINQRELHADTHSFSAAMRSALREDPDCVLIGEMRDLESTELALKLAETGHLTFATLHTNSAVQTINRIIDIFPTGQQGQIRTQLSFTLVAVISQTLLLHASGRGRVLVQEVLIPNAAIRNLIRDSKIHQVYSAMQSGQAEHGMKTFNQDLARLVMEKKIGADQALNVSAEKAELSTMLERLGRGPQARVGRETNDQAPADIRGGRRRTTGRR